jgi:hypothetical protein
MPHYKNKREAQVGDRVIGLVDGYAYSGTIVQVYPDTETCNATMVPNGVALQYVTLSNLLHVEDADLWAKEDAVEGDKIS